MNIVIKNQNFKIIDALTVDILKTFEGQFSLAEINEELINFYYEKVIIDITAIRNYYDINSVLIFLKNFEPNNTIIILNNSELINSPSFLRILIENGYYNFTKNAAGVNFLLNNPNKYEDVEEYTRERYVDEEVNNIKQEDHIVSSTEEKKTNLKSDYNEPEREDIKRVSKNKNQIVIGIQNLTKHAGATTLAYMMIRQLKQYYSVKGIEMNRQDFIYFRDSDLSLCTSVDDLNLKFKEYSDIDIIIIDLNGFDASRYCDDILYLIDPGLVSLNKMLKKDPNVKIKTENGKIILNRSALKDSDIPDFEYETKLKVFYNIGNVNDRVEKLQSIDRFLYKLGFKEQGRNFKSGIFKSK